MDTIIVLHYIYSHYVKQALKTESVNFQLIYIWSNYNFVNVKTESYYKVQVQCAFVVSSWN